MIRTCARAARALEMATSATIATSPATHAGTAVRLTRASSLTRACTLTCIETPENPDMGLQGHTSSSRRIRTPRSAVMVAISTFVLASCYSSQHQVRLQELSRGPDACRHSAIERARPLFKTRYVTTPAPLPHPLWTLRTWEMAPRQNSLSMRSSIGRSLPAKPFMYSS